MKPKVDIIIACSPSQSSAWWGSLLSRILIEKDAGNVDIVNIRYGSATVPDLGKVDLVDYIRNSKTDTNRNNGTHGFLSGDSEWAMWLDDDTIPPEFFITKLIADNRPFIGGIYHFKAKPFLPLAYIRDKNTGLYAPITDYVPGELLQVDGIGMGCTLIHRSVYEDIYNNYELFMRPNGTLVPVHKDDILDGLIGDYKSAVVIGDHLVTPLKKVNKEDYKFPFYALEYVRTEDFYFCELAERVGYKPFIDTNVQCKHLKEIKIDFDTYWNNRMEFING